jgi:DNA invertase Pin-like site-specific DNA recombinase
MKLEEIAKYHRAMARSVPDATTRSWHRHAAEFLGELARQKADHAKHIREGLAKAVRQGKQLGRSRIDPAVEAQARQMLAEGIGVAEIMASLKIGASTITRIRKEVGMPRGRVGRPAGE